MQKSFFLTTADQIMYCTRDHLGSARVLTDGTGAVIERNDYYPFGERMATGAMFPDNRWRFSGKEDQKIGTSGWLDFGARMYDTYTARWTTQDPLAEKYPSIKPIVPGNNSCA